MLARAAAPRPAETKAPLATETPPANDDRAAVRPIVQALQIRRPSRAPFVIATILSLAWLGLCGLYGYSRFSDIVSGATPLREALLRPETALFLLSALAPMFLLYAFAALSRRLQELRLSASSIAQVAMRLAEPEAMASEHFVTLSEAIRREVATMGDGVERAYSRASELDALVRAEVASIERSSGENERRIRSLIAEMADQREAIVANGAQVRAAIGDVHTNVAGDLKTIGDQLTERLSQTGERVAASLGASSEHIAITMDQTGSTTVQKIAEQSDQMHGRLAEIGFSVAERLSSAAERLAATMDRTGSSTVQKVAEQSDQLHSRLAEIGDTVAQRLTNSAEQFAVTIDRTGSSTVQRVAEQSDRMHERLVEIGATVADRLSTATEQSANGLLARVADIDAQIHATGQSLISGLDARTAEISGRIGEAGAQAVEAMQSRVARARHSGGFLSPIRRQVVHRTDRRTRQPDRRQRGPGARRASKAE